jgi:ubiquinone/menaquinone biosynthesis C-methylase UbiE
MSSRFTEQETESYYDAEDAIYRTVWDEDGSVHWGYFDETTGTDFLKGCTNLDRLMVERGGIDADARALDLGCGNGTTAIWLAGQTGCQVTGIDLSGVRIDNAKVARERQEPGLRDRLAFEKASATELPFPDDSFSHVWSQAVIYHVPDKRSVLKEVYRVLEKGGTFVFDDLIKPKQQVSPEAQRFVYDRLLYDTEFSYESYQDALKSQGFEILQAQDISSHLRQSYLCLADRVPKGTNDEHTEHYEWLTTAYMGTARAVENDELGWGLYICRK